MTHLTFIQQRFVQAANQTFPNKVTLTRREILRVCEIHQINQPQWLYKPEYNIARGLFKLPKLNNVHNVTFTGTLEPEVIETDEELKTRIADTYESMELLIESVADNSITSLCISGGAGLGKSYTVDKILREHNGSDYGFVKHSGYLKATHLYRLLWENKNKGQIIVIDDADIWGDETALQLCKAALELRDERIISWGSERVMEDQDGGDIPRYFTYQGSIIFLTNINIRNIIRNNGKNAAHLSALESRSMVFDMNITTKREYLHIIRQKVKDGLLKSRGLSKANGEEIVDFIEENSDNFRDLSLRMVEKISILFKAKPFQWKKIVKATFMN